MVTTGLPPGKLPGLGQHCSHLAVVLCAVCGGLLPLLAHQHSDPARVLVQLPGHCHRRQLDDAARCRTGQSHDRLCRQCGLEPGGAARRWNAADVRVHSVRPGRHQRVQPLWRVHVDRHGDRTVRPAESHAPRTGRVHVHHLRRRHRLMHTGSR